MGNLRTIIKDLWLHFEANHQGRIFVLFENESNVIIHFQHKLYSQQNGMPLELLQDHTFIRIFQPHYGLSEFKNINFSLPENKILYDTYVVQKICGYQKLQFEILL